MLLLGTDVMEAALVDGEIVLAAEDTSEAGLDGMLEVGTLSVGALVLIVLSVPDLGTLVFEKEPDCVEEDGAGPE